MQIEPARQDLRQLLKSFYFVIPRFQRPFSWENEHVEDFWTDVVDEGPRDYFIGAMVAYQPGKTADKRHVVDGQQRLTTATILLCALRDVMHEQGLRKLATATHAFIQRNNDAGDPEHVLTPLTSREFFENAIQHYAPDDEDDGAEENTSVATPKTTEEKLQQAAYVLLGKKVRASVDTILNDPKLSPQAKRARVRARLQQIQESLLSLQVISLTLDNEDDAYTVFETLNTRGLGLRLVDRARNHILDRAPVAKGKKADRAKTVWEGILRVLEEATPSISPDAFLVHFWQSRYDYASKQAVYKKLKKHVTKHNVYEFLGELEEDVVLYRTIREPRYTKTQGMWNQHTRGGQRSLLALNLFKVTIPSAMLLSTLRSLSLKQIKAKAACSALKAIEDYHFYTHGIASVSSSGGVAGTYSRYARMLKDAATDEARAKAISGLVDDLARRKPSFAEFEASFLGLQYSEVASERQLLRYVLCALLRDTSPGAPLDFTDASIEHLMPQGDMKANKVDSKTIHSIGNLYLLLAKYNSDLGDLPALEKLRLLQKAQAPLDEKLLAALQKNAWDKKAISERSKWIADRAYSRIWTIK